MEMCHIISGCSINLHQLTDRELGKLISDIEHRAVVLQDELELLAAESIRRTPLQVPLHSIPTDPTDDPLPESSVA